jgi:hypothetical protein
MFYGVPLSLEATLPGACMVLGVQIFLGVLTSIVEIKLGEKTLLETSILVKKNYSSYNQNQFSNTQLHFLVTLDLI